MRGEDRSISAGLLSHAVHINNLSTVSMLDFNQAGNYTTQHMFLNLHQILMLICVH